MRKVQRRLPYGPTIQNRWEDELINTVIAYIKQLDARVQPTERLYIAVDGVAPMAKIKQQRMRRFKSAVAAEEESRIRAEALGTSYISQPRWDTNAITPGTRFMEKLSIALKKFQDSEPLRILTSSADEAGEGEQKIMAYVRTTNITDAVVYGLDADLIVLSLWAEATQGIKMDLFREEVEFGGGVKEDALGEEQFLYLDNTHLADALYDTYGTKAHTSRADFICDFVGLMNLMGNDFVPHGMTLKIRDNGIERLLEMQNELRKHGSFVFQNRTTGHWTYNIDALRTLYATLAKDEPANMLSGCRKKLESRIGATSAKDADVLALARYNDQPVMWAAEKILIEQYRDTSFEKPQWRLRTNWAVQYDRCALLGADPSESAEVYLESLTWTLAYYSGAVVDNEWYYPWPLPPRAATIAALLESKIGVLPIPNTPRQPLKPLEQLTMVLPQSSFHLLPSEYSIIPTMYPYAWPDHWDLFSLGRRFLWECEPMVPLILPDQIRRWTAANVKK